MKTTKTYEVELQRHNVTPAQFLAYVRAQLKKKGLEYCSSDLDLRRWAAGDDMGFDYSDDPAKPCAAERSVSKPYQMQTYVRNWDGSVYNEICEFDFWDEKTGTGYYYLVNTEAAEEDRKTNEAEELASIAKRCARDAAQNRAKAAKVREYIEAEGRWLSESYIHRETFFAERLEREADELEDRAHCCVVSAHLGGMDIETPETEQKAMSAAEMVEDLNGLGYYEVNDEWSWGTVWADQTGHKSEYPDLVSAWVDLTAQGPSPEPKAEKKTTRRVFAVGDMLHWENLYGGCTDATVVGRTGDSIEVRISWVSEDTGHLCSCRGAYPVEVEEATGDELFVIWESHGDRGVVYGKTEEAIPVEADDQPSEAEGVEQVEATEATEAEVVTRESWWSSQTVRDACIRNNLYTRGDCEAYDQMLREVDKTEPTDAALLRIAKDIKEHSDMQTVTNVMYILFREAVVTTFCINGDCEA